MKPILILSLFLSGCALPSGSIDLPENHPANVKATPSPVPNAKAELMSDKKIDPPAPAPEHEVEHDHKMEAK